MKKILEYTLLEFKILFRVPISLFFTILFPQMLLFSFVLVSNNQIIYSNIHFVDIYLPLMMVLSMFSSGIISFSVIVAGNKSEKTWQIYRLKGFSNIQIILSQLFVNMFLQFISSILLVITSVIFFSALVPVGIQLFDFFCWWLLSSLTINMMGFVIGVFCKNEKVAQSISTPIMFVLMLLSGQMIQLDQFPEKIRNISSFLSTTQINIILSNKWLNIENPDVQIRYHIPWFTAFLSIMIVSYKLKKDQFS